MAIFLTTGAPGAGKTLRTIWVVEQLRKSSGRDVYYCGIADLNLPWIEFDDRTKWADCPDGAIIVIDEAQKAFRPRASGSTVPPYISALETHRHHGHDLYLITQEPMLIDKNIRALTEQHEHLMRKFGSAWATVHAWKGVKENCVKSRSDSMSSEFKYPKEVYSWYKSAEVHTVKFKLPKKVILLIFLPFIAALGLYFAYNSVKKLDPKNQLPSSLTTASSPSQQSQFGQQYQIARPKTDSEFLEQYKPRVLGMPWTAPRFDDLTQPVSVPVIRGCIDLGEGAPKDRPRAWCILDGGVYVYPPIDFIRSYIRDRFFIDFESTGRQGDYASAQPRNGDRSVGQNRPPANIQNTNLGN